MSRDDRVELEGSEPVATVGRRLRDADGDVEVLILVRPRRAMPSIDELPAALDQGVDPADFEAHPDDTDVVVKFATDHQLSIVQCDPRTRMVVAKGAAQDVATAFAVDLGTYTDGSRTFLCHTQPVSIPRDVHDRVEWVFGLDESPQLTTTSNSGFGPLRRGPAAEGTSSELVDYSVPTLARIYDFPEGTGAGTCVGIIALSGGYGESDLKAYFDSLGLEVPSIVCWKENTPSDPISNYQVVQDIEIAGAVVPKATIALYNANSSTTVKEFYRTFAAAIHDQTNRPDVLVNPWVFIENPLPAQLPGLGITRAQIEPFEQLFKLAVLRRITVCSASGSMGAMYPVCIVPADSSTSQTTVIPGLALPYANYPPSSPLNLAIGGTTLYVDDAGRDERVWNRLMNPMSVNGFPYNGGATGGGISYICNKPAYQAEADVPPGQTYSWDNGEIRQNATFDGRGVPDVSIDADAFTGYQIFFEGEWGVGGGTGVSVPLWGALVALLNQALGQRLGWVNPVLYELQLECRAEVFDLVFGGNNGAYDAPPDKPWNPCCGLGVPHGNKLLAALRERLPRATEE